MNQWTVSLYLSEPKAAFTPNCESVAVERGLICLVLLSESGR